MFTPFYKLALWFMRAKMLEKNTIYVPVLNLLDIYIAKLEKYKIIAKFGQLFKESKWFASLRVTISVNKN